MLAEFTDTAIDFTETESVSAMAAAEDSDARHQAGQLIIQERSACGPAT